MFGEYATPRTGSGPPGRRDRSRGLPPERFHSRTLVSPNVVASVWPLVEKLIDSTADFGPWKATLGALGLAEAGRPHRRTVPSAPPVASVLPLLVMATEWTATGWLIVET